MVGKWRGTLASKLSRMAIFEILDHGKERAPYFWNKNQVRNSNALISNLINNSCSTTAQENAQGDGSHVHENWNGLTSVLLKPWTPVTTAMVLEMCFQRAQQKRWPGEETWTPEDSMDHGPWEKPRFLQVADGIFLGGPESDWTYSDMRYDMRYP